MRKFLALVAALAGCAVDSPPVVRTFALDPAEPAYQRAAGAWAEIGIVEVAPEDADVLITIARPDDLLETHGTLALSDRNIDAVAIDARVSGFQLAIAVAHEVGHIVLDTPEHTRCGVMGGVDVVLCDEDRDLACRTIGACL